MKLRMTGIGGLSRKISAILTVTGMLLSGLAMAADATGPNSVYIQQVGSSNTITIEQVGGTNRVGGVTNTTPVAVDGTGVTTFVPAAPSSLNYGTLTGSTNNLSIIQHGNADSAQYNIQGNYNTYSSTVTGNSNRTSLTIGNQNNAANNNNTVSEIITGNSNMLITNVVGSNITSTTAISGSSNQVTSSLLSTNGSVTNTISGDSNIFNIQQTDSAGASGHVLVANTTGDYNSITTQQQGNNDTTMNILTTGSHNTITVRSSGAAIVNPVSAVAR